MKTGGFGGESTGTGLRFEDGASLRTALARIEHYQIRGDDLLFNGIRVARLLEKNRLYADYLSPNGVDYRTILSCKLLPDQALLVVDTNHLHVMELKYQQVGGSVDEKLQTCDFKKKQYIRLLSPLGVSVQYSYVLNDWFRDPRYRDVLNYITDVECRYFFNDVPLSALDLPT